MKRLLSWLLALVMIISCLPMSAIPAFAEETPEAGVEVTTGPSDFETPIDKLDPVVIEVFEYTETDAVQIAGDAEGNFYTYTAPADGEVTLHIKTMYDDEGNVIEHVFDIIVENLATKEQFTLLKDGKDNYGPELVVPVKAGQELSINTIWLQDAAGVEYPAGDYTWVGNFTYPAGSEKNPITIQWTWDDAYANATATVIVPEGGAYYTGKAGMILTVGETVTAMDETGKFNIAAAGTYELKLATPVGAQANPEVIENFNGFSDTVKLEAEGAYYYIWTATEDGTVTLDVTDGANIKVDQIIEMSEDGWPVSKQHELAEPEIDENWNYTGWTVAENLAIEVVTGQQLKIQVNGLTDWATWTVPAIEYTLTGSFEAAEPEYVPYLINVDRMSLSLEAELILKFRVQIPEELKQDENAYLKVNFAGEDRIIPMPEFAQTLSSTNRGYVNTGIASPYMDQVITLEIYDGKGNLANFYNKDTGVTTEGSVSFTGLDGAKSYLDYSVDTYGSAIEGLLTYGGYAQAHFKQNPNLPITNTPVYNMLSDYGLSVIDIAATDVNVFNNYAAVVEGDAGLTARNLAVALEAAVYMEFSFNSIDTNCNPADYTFELTYYDASQAKEVTVPVEAATRTLNSGKTRFTIKIENIAAALWDNYYTLTINNTATNQVMTYSACVMTFAQEQYSYIAGTAQGDLVKAMYEYNQRASKFFGGV